MFASLFAKLRGLNAAASQSPASPSPSSVVVSASSIHPCNALVDPSVALANNDEHEEGEIDDSPLEAAETQPQKKKRKPRTKKQKPQTTLPKQQHHQQHQHQPNQKPPPSYVCGACAQPGDHYFAHCSNPAGAPPDPSYLCVICRVPGHHVKWCPNKGSNKKKENERKPETPEDLLRGFKQWQQDNARKVEHPPATLQGYYANAFDSQNSQNSSTAPSLMSSNLNQSLYGPANAYSTSYEASHTTVSNTYTPTVVEAVASSAPLTPQSFSKTATPTPTASTSKAYPFLPPKPNTKTTTAIPTGTYPFLPPKPNTINVHTTTPTTTPTTTTTQDTADPPKPILPFCRFYAKSKCLNGTSCYFSHDKSTHPCAFLNLYGSCSRGIECAYSHDALSEEAKEDMRREHEEFKNKKLVEKRVWDVRMEYEKALAMDADTAAVSGTISLPSVILGSAVKAFLESLVQTINDDENRMLLKGIIFKIDSGMMNNSIQSSIGKQKLDTFFNQEFGMDFSESRDLLKKRKKEVQEGEDAITKKAKTAVVAEGSDDVAVAVMGNQKSVNVPDWIQQLQTTHSWGSSSHDHSKESMESNISIDTEFMTSFVPERFQTRRDIASEERLRIRKEAAISDADPFTTADNGTGVVANGFSDGDVVGSLPPVASSTPDWIKQLQEQSGKWGLLS